MTELAGGDSFHLESEEKLDQKQIRKKRHHHCKESLYSKHYEQFTSYMILILNLHHIVCAGLLKPTNKAEHLLHARKYQET